LLVALPNQGIKADLNHAGHIWWRSLKLISGVVWAGDARRWPMEDEST